MRRTARALSLAAVTGAALSVLVPVASASPPAPPEPGGATHSTCPPQKGHQQWEGQGGSPHEDDELAELEAELDALDAEEHDALVPDDTSADEAVPESGEGGGSLPEEPEALASDEPLVSENAAELSGSGSRKPTPKPSAGKDKDPHCGRTPVPGGVQAGGGGSFTDSVPALAAGGLLIAGAFGAAAHRIYRRREDRTHG
ncbi:hypothetical protein N4P33_15950 [Streptomyces sp. 15-116A]|uniref:hypothetical protein n=1 Tax=Streptomyces sp. 15-116A TaxID=2259035 RepID=UPI0021B40556|nr:hypothetical protein [Streptomyces sp. 15-116A]MCT7353652.1 hypothetical protein [Streptomyces sp. 15-116A]